jgi:sugar phosphate isomerase/epimerase
MHPRISVSAICSYRNTLEEDLALWERLGIRRVGLTVAKLEAAGLDAATRRLTDAGRDITNVIGFGPRLHDPATWPAHTDRMLAALHAAASVGADCFGLTTGPAGPLRWEEAADAFEEAIAPVLADARARNIRLVIEHTNSLRVDVGFVHSLRDMVDLARRVGFDVLCEVNACWTERGLVSTLLGGVDVLGLVQISDYVIGTKDTPNRVVPGDGDIPLQRFIDDVIAAGYDGTFDLEIIGPRIEAEGYESAIRRSVDALTGLLDSAGV